MKRKILIGLGIVLLIAVGFIGYTILTTKSHSPSQTAEFSHAGLDIKVAYCQPYKKGRVIFGDEESGALQPYGKYWRLGANEATEITFSKNILFAGKALPSGTYRMYAVPGDGTWQVGLNSELGQWGAMEPNYDLDVLNVAVPSQTSPDEVEQFTIRFSNDDSIINMDFEWDKTKARVPITIP